MSSTGRLSGVAAPGARAIVFGRTADADIDTDMPYMLAIDRAHVTMLAAQGLIGRSEARELVGAFDALEDTGYAPLRGRHAPRGLYLLYEGYLAEQVGRDTAGRLHTGRSRNDLKATVGALRLREQHARLLREALRCQAVALFAADRHRDALMAGFTHFQPAMPITYGFYLAGVAASLAREVDRLLAEVPHLQRCPLGAGAFAGTDLPIDPALSADLLGFAGPPLVALDTVAGRDAILAVLATAASISLTASRVALDLQVWSSPEPGLLEFPDELVGSSSAMPQKRNAYLLEHVRGRAGRVLGAHAGFAAAAKSAPYTNSIEVGTEAVSEAWRGFGLAIEAMRLLGMHLSRGNPVPDRMKRQLEDSWTTATAVANQLVREGIPFRQAHAAVGSVVTQRESGSPLPPTDEIELRAAELLDSTDASAALARSRYGGGPAPESFERIWTELHEGMRAQARQADPVLRTATTWRDRLSRRTAEVLGE